MKNFAHALLADLRERQILPAVVLLGLLALAIPIVASMELSKPAAPAPVSIPPLGVSTPHGVLPPAQEIEVVNAPPHQRTVVFRGTELSPFREGTSHSASTSGGSSSAGSGSGGSSSPSSSSSGSSTSTTTSSSSTPATGTTPTGSKPASGKSKSGGSSKGSGKSKPSGKQTPVAAKTAPTTGPHSLDSYQVYTAAVATTYGNEQTIAADIEREEAMPPNNSPEIVYLGVLKGGKKAAFLFTNQVEVTQKALGGAKCIPSASDCQIVELAPGQGMSLSPTVAADGISPFTFLLVSIGAHRYKSISMATSIRRVVSPSGQALVQGSTASALSTLGFDLGQDALIRETAPSGSTGSSGSSGASGTSGASG